MIKIPSIRQVKLNRGDIKLAHWPNGTLTYAAKNQVDEIRYFTDGYYPSLTTLRFAKSKSYRY